MTHGTANEMFTDLMAEFGIAVDPSLLPGPNTPLPPTNATIHVKDHETGYGTPDRKFVMICGTTFGIADIGEHKSFFRDETYWHKHVNCQRCLEVLASE